jgi:hypothetical protein
MKMGLENVTDCESIGFGFSEVFRNIALRINNDCFASRRISNEIAGMRETFQIELLEVQSGGRENWAHAQTIPPRVSFVNLIIPGKPLLTSIEVGPWISVQTRSLPN